MQKLRKRMIDKQKKNNTPEDLFNSEEKKMEAEYSFEVILKRLEEIVEKMESGGLGLEDSMKLYEEGIKKVEILTSKLAEARDKVMKLITNSEGVSSLEVFDEEESD